MFGDSIAWFYNTLIPWYDWPEGKCPDTLIGERWLYTVMLWSEWFDICTLTYLRPMQSSVETAKAQWAFPLSYLQTCCKVSQIKNSDYIESTAKLDVRFTPQISWNIKISIALQNISRVILRTNNFSWQVPRKLFYHDTKNKSFFLSVTCIPELRLNKGFTVP